MTRRTDDPRAARRHHGMGGAPVGALRPPVSPAPGHPAVTHGGRGDRATDSAHGAHDGGLVGSSAAMQRLRATIARYQPLTAPVLVLGETGSGKELAARGLHRDGPFVAINCAAIPRTLVEAELFGCVAGAFTGAVHRDGAFVQADGGTLLLDEIGDLPIDARVCCCGWWRPGW